MGRRKRPTCPRCNAAPKLGRTGYCAECGASVKKAWAKKNPEYYADLHLRNTRGITLDEKRKMFGEQEGRCAICESPMPFTDARVDHCHTQGHIRALLCNSCNVGIGLLGDSVELLERAARYIERHKR
jgi:hypothetical protein